MTFKESIISVLKGEKSDSQKLSKMLSQERFKITHFSRNLRKITFNELLISLTLLVLLLSCSITISYGVGISFIALFGVGPASTQIGTFTALSMTLLLCATLLFCAKTFKVLLLRFKTNRSDHRVMNNYTLKLKKTYQSFDHELLETFKSSNFKNQLKGGDIHIRDLTDRYETNVSDQIESLFNNLKDNNTKKYIRHYIYKDSHVSNDLTQVLYIHSTTLSIYSYFLEKCDLLPIKDISNNSIKSTSNS
ncbi:TPA: hypothetical protein MW242_003304 [Acinetobacter baumannii]|nr:hypothetical protein [Acinetobacter baumannii]